MPNVSATLYLSDDDYNTKYLPRKKEILAKMRTLIKIELGVTQKEETPQQEITTTDDNDEISLDE